MNTTPSPQQLASVLAALYVSRRHARNMCHRYGWGGGSTDLAHVLAHIDERPDVADIVRMAQPASADASSDVWPFERWIFGDGGSPQCEREYIIHTAFPRFIGQIFEDHADAPADGVTFAVDGGMVVGSIQWIDLMPSGGLLSQLNNDVQRAVTLYVAEQPQEDRCQDESN